MGGLFMRFPGGKIKAVTLSYDDGVEQDIRLMDIMKKHGLKGTFNLNGGRYAEEGTVYPAGTIQRRMSKSQCTELYKESGMEVAVHGYTHPFLEQLPANLCTLEVIKDRETLEEQFERIVRGMAYPFGTFNDEVVDCLKAAGIAYARTTISSHKFNVPTDWLRLQATCHHADEKLMELVQTFLEDEKNRAPMLFYLWGHSYEFEKKDNWDVIEKFAEVMGNREDIWYATNMEIYDYAEAFRRLVFSMDGKRIYNPTAYTLYFRFNDKDEVIQPGETKVYENNSIN